MSRGRMRKRAGFLCAALLAPAFALATPSPTAQAVTTGSLVYVKNGLVYIAHLDGTHARQFTKARYRWAWPSEADNGTVVIVGGLQRTNPDGTDSSGSSEIYRFKPDGNQISRPIPTWGSYSTPQCPTYGPGSTRVSPDASKVAYGIWSCSTAGFTTLWTPASSTTLNFPRQSSTGIDDYDEPSWITSSKFAISHVGTTVTSDQAWWGVERITSTSTVGAAGWNDSRVTGTEAQAVINRQYNRFVLFEDDGADYYDGVPRHVRLWVYDAGNGNPDTYGWRLRCTIGLNASITTHPYRLSPSIAPDGVRLYWGDDQGIKMARIGDLSSCSNVTPTLIVSGGMYPFASAGAEQPGANEPLQPGAVYPPHAKFTWSPTNPAVKQSTTFDGSHSYEVGGTIASYSWSFGDGTTASGKTVSHAFKTKGSFTVKLTVKDKRGVSASVSHTVTVG